MKKSLILVVFICSSFAIFAQTQKIGYVNSQAIFEQLPEAIKIQSDLDAMIAGWQGTLDSMSVELQTAYGTYQQQAANMTEDKRKQTEQDLLLKQQRAEQFKAQKFSQPNGEIFVKQEQMLKPVRDKVKKAISAVAKKEGMKFVFDKNETLPLILHADEEYNITFKVLDYLRTNK